MKGGQDPRENPSHTHSEISTTKYKMKAQQESKDKQSQALWDFPIVGAFRPWKLWERNFPRCTAGEQSTPMTQTWRDLSHTHKNMLLSCETKEPFWNLTSAQMSGSPERKIMIQPTKKNIKLVVKLVKL